MTHMRCSLPRWLAYWAMGWQLAMTDYRRKIKYILSAMSELSETVRYFNRMRIRWYLEDVKPLVDEMTSSFQLYRSSLINHLTIVVASKPF